MKIGEKEIFENKHVSNKHTLVGKIVSDAAGHGKNISDNAFKEHYLNNIRNAIDRSELFTNKVELLINNIGSNVGKFFEEILL